MQQRRLTAYLRFTVCFEVAKTVCNDTQVLSAAVPRAQTVYCLSTGTYISMVRSVNAVASS
jgi:hypothetical protein